MGGYAGLFFPVEQSAYPAKKGYLCVAAKTGVRSGRGKPVGPAVTALASGYMGFMNSEADCVAPPGRKTGFLMRRLCYISHNYRDTSSAGGKAKSDMECILESLGAVNLGNRHTYYRNKALHFAVNLWGIVRAVLSVRRRDIIVLQYPLKKYFSLVCRVARARGAQTVVLIHDLGSFRRRKLTVEQEVRRLSRADCLIALNPSMRGWLKEKGVTRPVCVLGIWDYLSPSVYSSVREEGTPPAPYTVIYAGGLSPRKNSFLMEMPTHVRNYRLELYGDARELAPHIQSPNIRACGFVASDELIATVRGHFGLVWDGSSLDGCAGHWGEYLRYNNPHKTSLYIRCGLPVIVWEESALAPFVREAGVGLCIASLRELDTLLPKVGADEYDVMKRNVDSLCARMASGHFFRSALNEAIGLLGE